MQEFRAKRILLVFCNFDFFIYIRLSGSKSRFQTSLLLMASVEVDYYGNSFLLKLPGKVK